MTMHVLRWEPGDAGKGGAAEWGRVVSSSPAIVLVHGLGDTADIWRPLMEHWRPPAPVLALDLPGHGRSPRLASDAYTVPILADYVTRALDAHAIRCPVLIGHSLGARVCVALAVRPALQARGTILVDMGVGGSDAARMAVSEHIDAVAAGSDSLDGLIGLFLSRLPLADPEAIGRAVPAMAAETAGRWHVPLDPAIKRLLAPADRGDITQALSKVAGPVGLVRGAYSAVLTKAGADTIAGAVPRQPVPVHVIEMAGHAIPVEQPGRLGQAVDACFAAMNLSL